MRTIHDHEVNPANATLAITVIDEPGSGGANHSYRVSGFTGDNPSKFGPLAGGSVTINFQNGPIPSSGVNGLTHEALLAIIADRLRSFQAGPYASKDNEQALTHIEEAQRCL